jgi:hypothetical protein
LEVYFHPGRSMLVGDGGGASFATDVGIKTGRTVFHGSPQF